MKDKRDLHYSFKIIKARWEMGRCSHCQLFWVIEEKLDQDDWLVSFLSTTRSFLSMQSWIMFLRTKQRSVSCPITRWNLQKWSFHFPRQLEDQQPLEVWSNLFRAGIWELPQVADLKKWFYGHNPNHHALSSLECLVSVGARRLVIMLEGIPPFAFHAAAITWPLVLVAQVARTFRLVSALFFESVRLSYTPFSIPILSHSTRSINSTEVHAGEVEIKRLKGWEKIFRMTDNACPSDIGSFIWLPVDLHLWMKSLAFSSSFCFRL